MVGVGARMESWWWRWRGWGWLWFGGWCGGLGAKGVWFHLAAPRTILVAVAGSSGVLGWLGSESSTLSSHPLRGSQASAAPSSGPSMSMSMSSHAAEGTP